MTSLIPSFFRLAKNISKYSDYDIKIGAVICENHRPISVGFNKRKSHPKYSSSIKATIHAEMAAIIASGKDRIENSTIFVYREYIDGTPALARPCESCMERLKEFGVKKIYYTTNEYPFWDMEKI